MRVSLAMIARDEAPHIAACIASLRDVVAEVVVVDTGSRDATAQIARDQGARVFDFPWCDDFAAARNAALERAREPWVLSMDADDLVDETNRARLGARIADLRDDNAGYMMQIASLNALGDITSRIGHVRLFPNSPRIRWERRVHEQIAPSIEASGGEIRATDVIIHHRGYVVAEVLKRKGERNLRLLELDVAERPFDPSAQFHLGFALASAGRREEAIVALHLSGIDAHLGTLHRKSEGLLARCYYHLGRREEALRIVRAARRIYPEDLELLYSEAQLCVGLGDLQHAETLLRAVIADGPASTADCMDCSVFGSAGYYLLALVLAVQGKHADSEEAARRATSLDPGLLPAWIVLADALAEQSKLDEIEALCAEAAAPETIRSISDVWALVGRGELDVAEERLRGRASAATGLVDDVRRWIQRAKGADGRRPRILDLMR